MTSGTTSSSPASASHGVRPVPLMSASPPSQTESRSSITPPAIPPEDR